MFWVLFDVIIVINISKKPYLVSLIKVYGFLCWRHSLSGLLHFACAACRVSCRFVPWVRAQQPRATDWVPGRWWLLCRRFEHILHPGHPLLEQGGLQKLPFFIAIEFSLTFPNSSETRVAAHFANRGPFVSEQHRSAVTPRRGSRSFTACMSASSNIEILFWQYNNSHTNDNHIRICRSRSGCHSSANQLASSSPSREASVWNSLHLLKCAAEMSSVNPRLKFKICSRSWTFLWEIQFESMWKLYSQKRKLSTIHS